MNDNHIELLIRLDEKLDALKEDVQEFKVVEKRVLALERFTSYVKGVAALLVGAFSYMFKGLFTGG